ncbi:MAG TPA: DUF2537 domain-containing protein [Pseudonocardia sp.]|uniref:DUF2537 domain-containing protein n=1 Tax=Pseudonocardia sp. TaxID=60912 RepID=UPI002B4B7C5D|nr:DUF2537 domain-containing protein [Pseudonocardia sp.]HLU57296.1 DUF2537 domain-containing protein [Pseudonocardia sp.]
MQLGSGGRVLLGERRADDPPLPAELEDALREWAAFAVTVAGSGGPAERDLLQRRGRQLAARLADALGRTVTYTDPVTGRVEVVPAPSTGPIPRRGADPEPTPWATGLTISAFTAVVVTLGDVALSRAFAEAFGLLWVPANILVGLGLAPSLHLLRHVRFWRWPALGAAAGLVAAWVVLLLGQLG